MQRLLAGPARPGQTGPLEEFQADVRQALGESFGEFVEAGQSRQCRETPRAAGGGPGRGPQQVRRRTRPLDLLSPGRPARPSGGLTFTVEQERIEQFADADRPVVESLEFVEPAKKDKTPPGIKQSLIPYLPLIPHPSRKANRRVVLANNAAESVRTSHRLRLDASLRDERRSGVLLHKP